MLLLSAVYQCRKCVITTGKWYKSLKDLGDQLIQIHFGYISLVCRHKTRKKITEDHINLPDS